MAIISASPSLSFTFFGGIITELDPILIKNHLTRSSNFAGSKISLIVFSISPDAPLVINEYALIGFLCLKLSSARLMLLDKSEISAFVCRYLSLVVKSLSAYSYLGIFNSIGFTFLANPRSTS